MAITTSCRNFTAEFKTCKADHPRYPGKRRNALQVIYEGYNAEEGSAVEEVMSAAALNACIESYAKVLIADHAEDWGYCPNIKQLSLSTWYVWYTTTAPKLRTVTTATLKAFGVFYFEYSRLLIGKSVASATVGKNCLEGRLTSIMGNTQNIRTMLQNLVSLSEAVEVCEDQIVIDELTKHQGVLDWCLDELADALGKVVEETSL